MRRVFNLHALGAREKVELRAAILGGERSAAAIAADFGCSERTVTRERAKLRAKGLRVPKFIPDILPESNWQFRARLERVARGEVAFWSRK